MGEQKYPGKWSINPAYKEEVDNVNHPPHYKQHPSGVECIEIAEHHNFCIGNAIKYLWRSGLKNNAVEDLKKAQWYITREIARLENVTEARK